jgi:hypothetical protein
MTSQGFEVPLESHEVSAESGKGNFEDQLEAKKGRHQTSEETFRNFVGHNLDEINFCTAF